MFISYHIYNLKEHTFIHVLFAPYFEVLINLNNILISSLEMGRKLGIFGAKYQSRFLSSKVLDT